MFRTQDALNGRVDSENVIVSNIACHSTAGIDDVLHQQIARPEFAFTGLISVANLHCEIR
jgi:hypothetical protein